MINDRRAFYFSLISKSFNIYLNLVHFYNFYFLFAFFSIQNFTFVIFHLIIGQRIMYVFHYITFDAVCSGCRVHRAMSAQKCVFYTFLLILTRERGIVFSVFLIPLFGRRFIRLELDMSCCSRTSIAFCSLWFIVSQFFHREKKKTTKWRKHKIKNLAYPRAILDLSNGQRKSMVVLFSSLDGALVTSSDS